MSSGENFEAQFLTRVVGTRVMGTKVVGTRVVLLPGWWYQGGGHHSGTFTRVVSARVVILPGWHSGYQCGTFTRMVGTSVVNTRLALLTL